jgi:hypothetical protein
VVCRRPCLWTRVFCVGPWIGAFFAYGLVLAPAFTRFVVAILANLTVFDYLHQATW